MNFSSVRQIHLKLLDFTILPYAFSGHLSSHFFFGIISTAIDGMAKLTGFHALASETDSGFSDDKVSEDRLERGPAYSEGVRTGQSAMADDEWPTYRHDAQAPAVKSHIERPESASIAQTL